MSFLGGKKNRPAENQKPLGTYADRLSTNEQARPVPWFCGKQRVGLTFISDVFDELASPVIASVGKKKSVSGYNYYSSFAAVACIGPVDGLHDIFFNGEPVYASETQIVIASISVAGSVVTCGTASSHDLVTGDNVVMGGVQPSEYNGEFSITVTDPTHFTYTLPATPSASPASAASAITARLVLDPVFRDADNPDCVDIVIPGFCEATFHWGTDTQERDDYLNSSGVAHPAYRGLAYIVFKRLFHGFNQTNVQTIELVLSRNPSQSWHSLADIEEDANIVTAFADALQNPRCGLAVADSRLNTAELLATAADVEAEGAGVSPLVNRQQEAGRFFESLLQYLDAFPTVNSSGQLGLKLARPADDLPEIADADMVTKPTFSTEDWATVFDETTVRYLDRDFGFNDMPATYRDPAAVQIVGEPSSRIIDRPWFTRRAVAMAYALSIGRAGALPEITGRVKLRDVGTLFNDLPPGALFTFNYSRRNLAGLTFRVIDRVRSDDALPEFEISYRIDRSYLIVTP